MLYVIGINTAEFLGLSHKSIENIACHLGDYLATKVDPGNREQKLIAELWSEAEEDEKMVLTKLIRRPTITVPRFPPATPPRRPGPGRHYETPCS